MDGLERTGNGARAQTYWEVVSGENLIETGPPTPLPSDCEDATWGEPPFGRTSSPESELGRRTASTDDETGRVNSVQLVEAASIPKRGVPAFQSIASSYSARGDLGSGEAEGRMRWQQSRNEAEGNLKVAKGEPASLPPSCDSAPVLQGVADRFYPRSLWRTIGMPAADIRPVGSRELPKRERDPASGRNPIRTRDPEAREHHDPEYADTKRKVTSSTRKPPAVRHPENRPNHQRRATGTPKPKPGEPERAEGNSIINVL